MGGELDLLVTPFRRAVDAGDQPRPMDPAQVAVDERVPGLGVVIRTVGEAEMPSGIVVPVMRLEELVLVLRLWLSVTPIAVQDVLLGIDEFACARHGLLVHRVRGHGLQARRLPHGPPDYGNSGCTCTLSVRRGAVGKWVEHGV